jgi:hypothetical protein
MVSIRSALFNSVELNIKNIVTVMEHAKSAGSLQSVMVNPKRTVLIKEVEHLLKIWLDD